MDGVDHLTKPVKRETRGAVNVGDRRRWHREDLGAARKHEADEALRPTGLLGGQGSVVESINTTPAAPDEKHPLGKASLFHTNGHYVYTFNGMSWNSLTVHKLLHMLKSDLPKFEELFSSHSFRLTSLTPSRSSTRCPFRWFAATRCQVQKSPTESLPSSRSHSSWENNISPPSCADRI